ncbi:MAG: ArsR/SmtB family transcription factor [Candidatus Natronoplasma sp.]
MDPLKILGSKARLEILHQLTFRDMYVSEIMEKVGMDGKTAKHHLEKLEEAGLIASREEGRRRYYSLEKEIILRISPSPNRRYEIQFPPVEEQG